MARCYDSYRRRYYTCNRAWSTWGRWVLFSIIVVGFILFFFLFSCLSARRRRKRGLQPFYGTGWVGNTPAGHGAANYNPQYQGQNQAQPQPQYNYASQQSPVQDGGYQNQTQGTYGSNQGYFGGQQTGTAGYYGGQQTGAAELQQPPHVYRAGDPVYAPPAGPPPGKTGL